MLDFFNDFDKVNEKPETETETETETEIKKEIREIKETLSLVLNTIKDNKLKEDNDNESESGI